MVHENHSFLRATLARQVRYAGPGRALARFLPAGLVIGMANIVLVDNRDDRTKDHPETF